MSPTAGGFPPGRKIAAVLGEERIGRETVARETYRRRRDLAERHRAKACQRLDPNAGRGGNHAVQKSLRDAPAMMSVKELEVG
jgi:hypothetical protein